MRRSMWLIITLIVLSGVSMAQIGLRKGIVGGLQLATVGGSDVAQEVAMTPKFAVGGFLELTLPFGLALRPEVLYSVKGMTRDVDNPSITVTQTLRYLEVPVLVKYHVGLSTAFPVYVIGGPTFASLRGAELLVEGSLGTSKRHNKDSFANTDIGLIVGAGVDLPKDEHGQISIDVRYNYGLSKLDEPGQVDMGNRVLSFMISIAF